MTSLTTADAFHILSMIETEVGEHRLNRPPSANEMELLAVKIGNSFPPPPPDASAVMVVAPNQPPITPLSSNNNPPLNNQTIVALASKINDLVTGQDPNQPHSPTN